MPRFCSIFYKQGFLWFYVMEIYLYKMAKCSKAQADRFYTCGSLVIDV